MAQNVLAMTLKMRNTAARTANDLKKQVKGIGDESMKMGTKFGKAVKATRTSIEGLLGSMISLKSLIIMTFAYRLIQRFGNFLGSLTDLFKEQEKSLAQLSASLSNYGEYSKEVVDDLRVLSDALQWQTGIDNEVIEANMALLASYGFTATKIKEVTELTLDFAKSKQIQLKTAFDLVGKASVGYTGTLSRYGIILDEGLSKEAKYAEFLERIAVYFGNATRMAKSYEGQMSILNAGYDDWKRDIGEVIALGLQQSGILDAFSKSIKDNIAWLQEWKPLLSYGLSVALVKFRMALTKTWEVMTHPATLAWLSTFGNAFTIVFRNVATMISVVGTGIEYMVHSIVSMWLAVQQIKAEISGDTDLLDVIKEAVKVDNEAWKQRLQSAKAWKTILATLKKDAQDIAEVMIAWEKTGDSDFAARMRAKYAGMNEELRILLEQLEREDELQNQNNQSLQEGLNISKSIAQQYALASRLEQEQTKAMLNRIAGMTPGEAGGLSELERKLIGRQGVLKDAFTKLFGEYAERELSISINSTKNIKTKIEIGLTEAAKKLIEVISTTSTEQSDSNIERLPS